jgi:hypothetical protein
MFTNYLCRSLPPTPTGNPTTRRPSKRFLHNTRWRGTCLLPYIDDFIFLADSYDAALLLQQRVDSLLERLGLLRNPTKGVWTPTQVGDHLGLIVDLKRGKFRAPPDKLRQLAQQPSPLLGRAASNARWLPSRQVAAFARKPQFLHHAIAPARFSLRELHNVLATRRGWGGRVLPTHEVRRDLKWWRTVPT